MNVQNALNLCIEKLEITMQNLPADLPQYGDSKTGDYFHDPGVGKSPFFGIWTWTPSFMTGQSLLAYEYSKDSKYLDWAKSFYQRYYDKVFFHADSTMHDLGFLYTPYATAIHRITGDAAYRDLAIKAADELCKRFRLTGNYIRAFGKTGDMKDELAGLAIMDCMMNLSLLFYAHQQTGTPLYREIAQAHADTTLKHFINEDHTFYQSFFFDPVSGAPLRGDNGVGYEGNSFWNRGCGWAVYGFHLAYMHTQNETYLNLAKAMADKYIAQIKARGDGLVPVWDFGVPPENEQVRDSSAGAIMATALFDLGESLKQDAYKTFALNTLDELLDPAYFNPNPEIPGFLAQSNGKNSYTLYGDYYFMELLLKAETGFKAYW